MHVNTVDADNYLDGMQWTATRNEAPIPVRKIIDFKQEPLSESLVAEMTPLWRDHYIEIALYQDIPLSPIVAVYETAAQCGSLRIYTARYGAILVGYQIFFVHPHPHYSTMLSANQDILFLAKQMRKGLIGYRFIKWCDEQLQHDGVNVVFQHAKKNHDFGSLLKRLGYVDHDIVYSRRLS